MKLISRFKVMVIILCILIILAAIAALGINAHVKHASENYIIDPAALSEFASQNDQFDCAIVLGCKVKPNGIPSDMLHDRLERGLEVYNAGAAAKLLMSGDHGTTEYDEVNTMKQYAIDAGVPSSDVFMDHAGFSTYESMYRARDIFQAKRVIIVTQEYHLYRAIYIARALGLDAYGVPADYQRYIGQSGRDAREILARDKDFFKAIFKPEPTYLGDVIPISGSGDATND